MYSRATQPYIYMYDFSPKLPSHPGVASSLNVSANLHSMVGIQRKSSHLPFASVIWNLPSQPPSNPPRLTLLLTSLSLPCGLALDDCPPLCSLVLMQDAGLHGPQMPASCLGAMCCVGQSPHPQASACQGGPDSSFWVSRISREGCMCTQSAVSDSLQAHGLKPTRLL